MSATKEWFMSHEEQQSFQLVGDYPNRCGCMTTSLYAESVRILDETSND